MQYHRTPLRTLLLLCGLIILAAVMPLAPLPATPAVQAAPLAQAGGSNFASAVPCFNATQSYAIACYAETVVDGSVGNQAAVALLTKGGVGASLASLDQLGSIYGLA